MHAEADRDTHTHTQTRVYDNRAQQTLNNEEKYTQLQRTDTRAYAYR